MPLNKEISHLLTSVHIPLSFCIHISLSLLFLSFFLSLYVSIYIPICLCSSYLVSLFLILSFIWFSLPTSINLSILLLLLLLFNSLENFSLQCLQVWNLRDSKATLIFKILLSILVDLNNTGFLMVSIFSLISKASGSFVDWHHHHLHVP